MAMTLQQIVTQLDESGVLSVADTTAFQETQAEASKTAKDLVKLLVKHKKVTKLQAQMIYQGKGKQLLLGNYLILDKIGAGGMGVVYLAEHRRMERRVALKTLPAAMTKDDQSIQRFHREVKAAAKLNHPNIVTAHDADEAKGIHYFVMEHVEGVDLAAYVKQQGAFSVELAVNYIMQAATGLEYAHNKGIVHRDIKPSNMLLDKEGVIKILDMGLARIDSVDDENPVTALTQSGSVMGTVDYMSPEQAQNSHTADNRADIYSLGCSLYYLLTADSVYGAQTVVNRIMAHRDQPIPSLSASHSHVPADVDAVYQKMIAKLPEDRFQSMREVIAAFQNCGLLKSSSSGLSDSTEPSNPEWHKFLQAQQVELTPTLIVTADEKPLEKTRKETFVSGMLENTVLGGSAKLHQKVLKAVDKKVWIATGVVLAGLMLLAGIFLMVKTPAGTIILEIAQPELAGAVVSVDDQQKITIKTGEGKEPIEVVADEKKHTLKVTKGGFETFTKQFTVKAGGKETIRVRLELAQVTANKNKSTNTPSRENYALKFDGSDKVLISSLKIESPAEFTIELIVKPEQQQHGMIVCDADFGGLSLKVFNNRWKFDGYGQVQRFSISSDEPVAFKEWSHVAAVISGKKVKLFVNGQLQKMTARLDNLKPSSLPVVIGANPEPNGFRDYFHGSIRTVRITGSALYSKSFTPPKSFVRDKKTMALYHFDEAKGDVLKDSSGNNHHSKIVGAKWVKVDDELKVVEENPKENYALRFDGDMDIVTLPLKHDQAGDLTVEAWVALEERTEIPQNIILNGGNQQGFILGIAGATSKGVPWSCTVVKNKSYQILRSKTKGQVGKRTHVAVSFKGTTAQLYVNGQMESELNFADSKIHTDYPITFGKAISNDLRFRGLVNEVRISNIARYTKNFTPTKRFVPDKHTMALYHFDEAKGDVLKDSSGNGHDGKVVGAKWVKVDDELKVIEPATTSEPTP